MKKYLFLINSKFESIVSFVGTDFISSTQKHCLCRTIITYLRRYEFIILLENIGKSRNGEVIYFSPPLETDEFSMLESDAQIGFVNDWPRVCTMASLHVRLKKPSSKN